MEITYPELEEFKKVSSRMEKQLNKLRNSKQESKDKLNELQAKEDQMIVDEATLGKEIPKSTMKRLVSNKEKLESEITQFETRINAIESKQEEILAEYLPGLHEGYKREKEKLFNEIRGKLTGIIPAALPYLEHLAEIGKLNKKGTRLYNSFLQEAKKADEDFEHKHYRFGTGFDEDIELFDGAYFGNRWGYGISKGEQNAVFLKGGLPYRHALYKQTGEVEPRYYEAESKYKNRTQEEGNATRNTNNSDLEEKLNKLQLEIKELEKQEEEAIYSRNRERYKEVSKDISKLKAERRKLKGMN